MRQVGVHANVRHINVHVDVRHVNAHLNVRHIGMHVNVHPISTCQRLNNPHSVAGNRQINLSVSSLP
jgi:hypothetical protein